jgi:hypothetical protein
MICYIYVICSSKRNSFQDGRQGQINLIYSQLDVSIYRPRLFKHVARKNTVRTNKQNKKKQKQFEFSQSNVNKKPNGSAKI